MDLLNVYNVALIGENILGPGQRIGIWLQGCEHACPECLVPESWDVLRQRDLYTPEELFSVVKNILNEHSKVEGITLSGGEPFLQSVQLLEFVKLIKSSFCQLDVLCYSGYLYEDLQKISACEKLLQYIDILIDGPYINKLNNNQMWRGSENQRIILLNDNYDKNLFTKIKRNKFRKIEIYFKDFSYNLVGIPPCTLGANFEASLE